MNDYYNWQGEMRTKVKGIGIDIDKFDFPCDTEIFLRFAMEASESELKHLVEILRAYWKYREKLSVDNSSVSLHFALTYYRMVGYMDGYIEGNNRYTNGYPKDNWIYIDAIPQAEKGDKE